MSKIVLAPTPRAPGSRQASARPKSHDRVDRFWRGHGALGGLVMSEIVLAAKRQGGELGRRDSLRPIMPPAIVPLGGAAPFLRGVPTCAATNTISDMNNAPTSAGSPTVRR